MNPSVLTGRLTLRHLRLVWVVGQELNLSRAARRLHTSQPAVSAALRELEGLVDAKLFERTTRKVELTPLGRALWLSAERVLAEMDRAALEFEAARAGSVGELHVGLIPQVPASLLSGAVRRLHHAGEDVPRLHVHEGAASSLARMLAVGQLDLMISHLAAGGLVATPLEIQELYQDTTCLVVAPSHPLARRKRLAWEDVRQQRWLLPPSDVPARARIEREMLLRGAPDLRTAIDVSSQNATLHMLDAAAAVAVLNVRVASDHARQGRLVVLPLSFEIGTARFALLRQRVSEPAAALVRLAGAIAEEAQGR